MNNDLLFPLDQYESKQALTQYVQIVVLNIT